jgi:multiple sugar transport system substrate-binding protein
MSSISSLISQLHQAIQGFCRRGRGWFRPSFWAVFVLSLIIVSCTASRSPNLSEQAASSSGNAVLTVWWDKGYILEEDEALQQVIQAWEQHSGKQAELSFYTADEIDQKTLRAIQAGDPPDVLFSSRAEYPLLAWEGKLADVSEVIEPVANLYSSAALQSAQLYNNLEKKQSYYAVPLHQAAIHIFYWKDLVEQAGYGPDDIPSDWDGFWTFWQTVQDRLRSQSSSESEELYGLGLPFSIGASDTYEIFEQILEAYDVQILDEQGQLQLDDPQVRTAIAQCLDWYTQFYRQGYVPTSATRWLDPDNNRNLLDRVVVMTPNPTLSIPITLRLDPDTYLKKLGTLEFPRKPNGDPLRHLVKIRQAVVLADAPHPEEAKDFLAYLIEPSRISNYLKSAGGRYLPVMPIAQEDDFWTNPEDPHVSIATQTLVEGDTRPSYSFRNPVYSRVLEENVWGKTLNRILIDGISPEQAADTAIQDIQQIFKQWQ